MSIADNIRAAIIMLLVGAAGGMWLYSSYYRPLLDDANRRVASVTAARDNCVAVTTEQGLKLGELMRQADDREQEAKEAQVAASTKAKAYESKAIRVLTERIGGDQCVAASTVIDLELGL